MKKIVTRIINAVSIVVIVLALFILCTVVMTKPGKAPEILGHYVFRVMTGSMQPAVPEDSLPPVSFSVPSDKKAPASDSG